MGWLVRVLISVLHRGRVLSLLERKDGDKLQRQLRSAGQIDSGEDERTGRGEAKSERPRLYSLWELKTVRAGGVLSLGANGGVGP